MRILASVVLTLCAVSAWAVEIKSVTLAIDNMTCSLCKNTVTRALNEVDGVRRIDVDVGKRIAVVRYDAEKTGPAALAEATADAGYPAEIR